MNEEMYEEEDDHHMARFAHLTRGIATGNPSMNRSVQAMLAAQIGMREHMSSLFGPDANTNASFEQHFPGYSSQSFNNQTFNPSAFDQHAPMHMDSQSMQSMDTYNRNSSNNMHNYNNRQAPYPTNTNGNMAHSRSASIALPAHQAQPQQTFTQQQPGFTRRHSMATSQPQHSASASPSAMNTQSFMQDSGSFFGQNYTTNSNQYNMMNNDSTGFTDPFATGVDNMFTSALPTESQQIIGNNFNPSVFDASLMNGYGSMNQQWDFATNAPRNSSNSQKTNNRGLDTTLAPPAMSRSSSQGEFNTIGGPNSGMGFIDLGYIPSSQSGSVATTPGIEGWDNFINEGCWDSLSGN